jgi:hypothetical protein
MYHVVGILAQCYPLYAMVVEPAGEVIAQQDVMVLGPAGVQWSLCKRADSVAQCGLSMVLQHGACIVGPFGVPCSSDKVCGECRGGLLVQRRQ